MTENDIKDVNDQLELLPILEMLSQKLYVADHMVWRLKTLDVLK